METVLYREISLITIFGCSGMSTSHLTLCFIQLEFLHILLCRSDKGAKQWWDSTGLCSCLFASGVPCTMVANVFLTTIICLYFTNILGSITQRNDTCKIHHWYNSSYRHISSVVRLLLQRVSIFELAVWDRKARFRWKKLISCKFGPMVESLNVTKTL